MPPIHPPPADAVVALGIGGLSWVVAAVVAWIWGRYVAVSTGRAVLVIAAWLVVTGGVAASGLLRRVDVVPPPAALLIAVVLLVAVAVSVSRPGTLLATRVPLVVLVGVQSFRLPLELVMHRAGERGIMPPELSYGGFNFDIVTGAAALLIATALRAGWRVPGAVLWVWNTWGLWCLAVILAIAVASSPMVRAFGDDPRHINTWVLHLPYVWLPTVLVVIALAGHVVTARALASGRRW